MHNYVVSGYLYSYLLLRVRYVKYHVSLRPRSDFCHKTSAYTFKSNLLLEFEPERPSYARGDLVHEFKDLKYDPGSRLKTYSLA
jgi:hypothetical protein